MPGGGFGFVDVHSHVAPSGDDGASAFEEAVRLCRLAVEGGTSVLFATPHAHAGWDHFPRTPERERLFEQSFPRLRAAVAEFGLELRRGWEVFPTVLRDHAPEEFALEGTRAVLVEFPGHWLALENDGRLVLEAAARISAARLVPIIAHPERSIGLQSDLAIATELVERGCLLCPNGDSLLGANGPAAETLAWQLLDEGLITLIASDGHRPTRPPRLDQAHKRLTERYGAQQTAPLFDGSAIPWTEDLSARAAIR
jgi:protein-tyrosine phosphatase